MSDKQFADSNILIYAFDAGEPAKQAVAQEILAREGAKGDLVISTQVLQEFFVVVTRKLKTPLSLVGANEAVEAFAVYPLVQVDLTLISRAIGRLREEQVSFWDALIIEAALESNCGVLLSEDLQHGRRIQGLTIHNPFLI